MDKPMLKRVVRLSWIWAQAKEELEQLRREPDLDPDFFTDDEFEDYIDFLIRVHADEWLIIDDVNDEREA